MNPKRYLAANPDVVLREEFDDWGLLFNLDTTKTLGINPTGIYIWKRLDGKQNLFGIMNCIKNDFSDIPSNVEEEVGYFIEKLETHGFASESD